MATGTNAIATLSDCNGIKSGSFSSNLDKCVIKTEAVGAGLTVGSTYGNNQCVKYSDLSYVSGSTVTVYDLTNSSPQAPGGNSYLPIGSLVCAVNNQIKIYSFYPSAGGGGPQVTVPISSIDPLGIVVGGGSSLEIFGFSGSDQELLCMSLKTAKATTSSTVTLQNINAANLLQWCSSTTQARYLLSDINVIGRELSGKWIDWNQYSVALLPKITYHMTKWTTSSPTSTAGYMIPVDIWQSTIAQSANPTINSTLLNTNDSYWVQSKNATKNNVYSPFSALPLFNASLSIFSNANYIGWPLTTSPPSYLDSLVTRRLPVYVDHKSDFAQNMINNKIELIDQPVSQFSNVPNNCNYGCEALNNLWISKGAYEAVVHLPSIYELQLFGERMLTINTEMNKWVDAGLPIFSFDTLMNTEVTGSIMSSNTLKGNPVALQLHYSTSSYPSCRFIQYEGVNTTSMAKFAVIPFVTFIRF